MHAAYGMWAAGELEPKLKPKLKLKLQLKRGRANRDTGC
jgi:hypothetical protein